MSKGKRGKVAPASGWSEPLVPGSLRKHTWKRFLRGPDPELVEKLYTPALGEAIGYDRCCTYFSSSVLSAAARGFAGLIRRLRSGKRETIAHDPPIRLLVNEELTESDVRALTETGDATKLEAQLQKRFKTPKDALELDRLGMLAWLVAKGFLDVRVGVMRRTGGIAHAKYGLVTDEASDAIVFRGSDNESARAIGANYESLEVSASWQDPDALANYRAEFDALWRNEDPYVYTVSLPDALRRKLIKFAPEEPPVVEPSSSVARAKAAMLWEFIREAPYLPNGAPACDATAMVDLWPHQVKVVEEVAAAWPAGRLMCDEVGMGKTIEAIVTLRRLMAGRGVRRVLVLVPAGLLGQWQGELREKGGLIFPRHEGSYLIWPDGRRERAELPQALQQDALVMSRETARVQGGLPHLLAAEPWDIVLMDEAHAARRAGGEGDFNAGNLLLDLLRQLQLRRKARGILLLSATPMQTQVWEPWDLLSVLGEGGRWLSEFSWVRDYYGAVTALERGRCLDGLVRRAAQVVASDTRFPPPPGGKATLADPEAVAKDLAFASSERREEWAKWLRANAPLTRRMHRNTRSTLRRYYELGKLPDPPPARIVRDVVCEFLDSTERHVYNSVTDYIDRRFKELEEEKKGKGFVMTVYRRRAASCPYALQRSLERRRDGLLKVIHKHAYAGELPEDEQLSARDVGDAGEDEVPEKASAALPEDPEVAKKELSQVEHLLEDIKSLGSKDSKRDKFWEEVLKLKDEGRSVLIFTEYADTMEYVRGQLTSVYGNTLGSYCGSGGHRLEGGKWVGASKGVIAAAFQSGELHALVCTDAASEGLNLQAASAVINYDLPWNPSKVEQRIGRADRIGQRHAQVLVVNLFLKDSVDEKVYGALRRRCHLFEQFVGPMQPVLSRARRILCSGQTENIERDIDATADEAEKDVLAQEFYQGQEADPAGDLPAPSVSRGDMQYALSVLTSDRPVSAAEKEGIWTLRGLGGKRLRASWVSQCLEADDLVAPLTPESDVTQSIVACLKRQGELLPLVVGSYSAGAFRASVALWIGNKGVCRVESFDALRKLLNGWSGDAPKPHAIADAQRRAEEEARELVSRMAKQARSVEGAEREAQLAAARERLVRELGRYLASLGHGTSDLDGVFYNQMKRGADGSARLDEVYKRLGGYPTWSPELLEELRSFDDGLTKGQRQARLAMKEIDATLQDPRWAAASDTA